MASANARISRNTAQQSRGGKGIITMKTTEKTGGVVGALTVRDTDEIMLITFKGQMVRTFVKDIREAGRNTQGVKLIDLDAGDKLQAIAPVIGEDKEDAAGETRARKNNFLNGACLFAGLELELVCPICFGGCRKFILLPIGSSFDCKLSARRTMKKYILMGLALVGLTGTARAVSADAGGSVPGTAPADYSNNALSLLATASSDSHTTQGTGSSAVVSTNAHHQSSRHGRAASPSDSPRPRATVTARWPRAIFQTHKKTPGTNGISAWMRPTAR